MVEKEKKDHTMEKENNNDTNSETQTLEFGIAGGFAFATCILMWLYYYHPKEYPTETQRTKKVAMVAAPLAQRRKDISYILRVEKEVNTASIPYKEAFNFVLNSPVSSTPPEMKTITAGTRNLVAVDIYMDLENGIARAYRKENELRNPDKAYLQKLFGFYTDSQKAVSDLMFLTSKPLTHMQLRQSFNKTISDLNVLERDSNALKKFEKLKG
jgi:hypothetical protein